MASASPRCFCCCCCFCDRCCGYFVQVGEQLLRELVFIHLEQPSDKLQLVVQMLLKLYALVSA